MWPMLALAAFQAVQGAKEKQKAAAVKGIQDSKVDLSDEGMSVPQPAAASNGWKDAAMSMGTQMAGSALSGPAGKKPETPVSTEPIQQPEVITKANPGLKTKSDGWASRKWREIDGRP